MKKLWSIAVVAITLALGGGAVTPGEAVAAEAGSVCQFYKGEPICKTVVDSHCIGGSLGVEAKTCRTTTEYWYWS